jgi:hypothetical protein
MEGNHLVHSLVQLLASPPGLSHISQEIILVGSRRRQAVARLPTGLGNGKLQEYDEEWRFVVTPGRKLLHNVPNDSQCLDCLFFVSPDQELSGGYLSDAHLVSNPRKSLTCKVSPQNESHAYFLPGTQRTAVDERWLPGIVPLLFQVPVLQVPAPHGGVPSNISAHRMKVGDYCR